MMSNTANNWNSPRMRYDQGMYKGVTWFEAWLRFEILERLQRRFGS